MEREGVDLCFLGRGKSLLEAGDAPSPSPSLLAAPGLAKSKVLSKSLFLSPYKTSNNSTSEEVSVFFVSWTVTLACCLKGLLSPLVLYYCCYSFFCFCHPCPAPPSLFLSPSPTTQASRNATISSQITSPCPTQPPSPSSLQPGVQLQQDSHPPASCIPPLQNSLKFRNFDCIFKSMCVWTQVSQSLRVKLLAHGLVESAMPQMHLRQGTSPSFQDHSAVIAAVFRAAAQCPDPHPEKWRPRLQVLFSSRGFEPLHPASWEDNPRHLSGSRQHLEEVFL